jgi:hypothetical protein
MGSDFISGLDYESCLIRIGSEEPIGDIQQEPIVRVYIAHAGPVPEFARNARDQGSLFSIVNV